MLDIRTIAIIGMGRLGSQLAAKLSPHHDLIASDNDPAKSEKVDQCLGITWETPQSAAQQSDIFIIVVPPEDVLPLFTSVEPFLKSGSIVVNMATSVDTKQLDELTSRQDIAIIGMKPVAQALGLAKGFPVVFVTSSTDQQATDQVKNLLEPIGEVCHGEEMIVREINAKATDHALRLCIRLRKELESAAVNNPSLIEAAIKTVAVGTIIDFPPELPNYYIEHRLNAILQEE